MKDLRDGVPKKEYDIALKSRALTSLTLRVAIAGYIIYLAWKLMFGAQKGGSSIPDWGVWLICTVFTAAALAFLHYAWNLYKKALKAAQISAPQEKSNSGE